MLGRGGGWVGGGVPVGSRLPLGFSAAEAASRVASFLELVDARHGRSLPEVLGEVAEAIRVVLGWRVVVVNVYRPESDVYEVVHVAGDDRARDALLHTTNTRESFSALFTAGAFERVLRAFFIPEDAPAPWDRMNDVHTPQLPTPTTPEGWRAGDALLVDMRSSAGAPLGILSVDAPVCGLRPTDTDLEMLVAVSAHAALALEAA